VKRPRDSGKSDLKERNLGKKKRTPSAKKKKGFERETERNKGIPTLPKNPLPAWVSRHVRALKGELVENEQKWKRRKSLQKKSNHAASEGK